MRRILLALIVTVFLSGAASAEVIMLDLSKATTIEYNEKNIWNDVYKD